MLATLLSATLAVAPPGGPGLSEVESRIVAHIDAHAEEAVRLLERLVNINSGTMNHEGVRRVGEAIRPRLAAAGFETTWIDMPEQVDRAGHLFAFRRGERGRRVLLIGHLDTVFEADSPFQTFEREGERARGPGTEDMKGGDVVIVHALEALQAVGALDGTTVTVAFTGDEEDPGSPLSITRRDLVAAARSSDVALEFESLVADEEHDYATIARRGASDWTLTASGRIGHSSGVFGQESGYGAVYEAARILDAFRRELAGEPHLTFNPGLVLGGTEIRHDAARQRGSASGKTNVIAPTVVVAGDVRTISSEQADRARERMREIVSAHLPGTSAEIVFGEGYPPMAPTAGNEALLELLNEINRDLGAPALLALDPDRRGAADSSFAAPYTDCLAGLGMRGEGGHTPDESVDLRTLPLQVKRAALLVYRLTR